MNLEDLINVGKRILENAGLAAARAALDDGFILKTDAADYFVGNVNGRFEHRKLESKVDMQALVRPTKIDLRGRVPDLHFPLRIPYSTLGSMGPLSGSSGEIIIHQDGRVELHTMRIS
jgi:hypothetical protein